MKINRCPVCHSRIHFDAVVQDECARELLGIFAKMDTLIASALLSYLSLFRSETRDLSNDKTLRLIRDLEQLSDWQHLAVAMAQTVEQIRNKKGKPLINHNYLKQVLADTPQPTVAINATTGQQAHHKSRFKEAFDAIDEA